MKKRLILCNAAVIIVGFIAAFLLAAFQIQSQYEGEFTKRLDAVLSVMQTEADAIEADPDGAANAAGDQLKVAGQEVRISIIDTEGNVIGDSESDEINENHMDRPEIKQALANGEGSDTRMSSSVNRRFYYKAVYVADRFFIRAALPTADLDAIIGQLWWSAILCMLLGIAIVCTVTCLLYTSRCFRATLLLPLHYHCF